MKIKDRPEFANKAAVFTLDEGSLVSEAIATMSDRNIGSVVIVDADRKVKGIFTERDVLRRVLARKLDPSSTTLSAVMTPDPLSASPDDEVVDWLRMMSNERFRHLPIIDQDRRLITVMSQGDFVSYTWPDLLDRLRAKATETIKGPGSPLIILVAGIMLYSLLMVVALKYL